MSQALGFGKPVSQSLDPVTERRKNRLLATIYMHDQMLSLRLGRPSAMGGYTLPMDEAQWLAEVNTVELKIMPRWIGVARIQGRIYDWLYSPAAMAQPVAVRAEKAAVLLGELQRVQRVQCDVEVSIPSGFPPKSASANTGRLDRKSGSATWPRPPAKTCSTS